jgi:hypothetical protein
MGLTRNHCVRSVFVFLLPLMIVLFSDSSVYGQWTAVVPSAINEMLELQGVHFTSADEGWAVGRDSYQGALLHYQNGIWTQIVSPTVSEDWHLTSVHFTSTDEGWAVGYDFNNNRGVLLHYHNGTWTSVDPPVVGTEWWEWWGLVAVHFTSADEGWAVGNQPDNNRGILLHYHNGTWTSVDPPSMSGGFELYGVHFTSANEGWAVGNDTENDRGLLLHYQSGTWTTVAPPTVSTGWWELTAVHFTSVDEGWAVGNNISEDRAVLLHYRNGTWMRVTPPAFSGNRLINSVHFTSATEGWAVGNDTQSDRGFLLHYRNGTWTRIAPPTVSENWDLASVHFTSATEGWAVGASDENGVLLHFGPISVTLLSPNGGNEISTDSTFPITWETTPDSPGNFSFNVKYSLDNGLTWLPVTPAPGAADSVDSEHSLTGSFTGTQVNWAVPLLVRNKPKCLVKVIAYDGTKKLGSDKSDGPFGIKVLSITSPSPSDTCASGEICTITWEKELAVDAQTGQLSYSSDGGLSWKTISSTITGSDTSWDWTPSVKRTKTNCKVRLIYKDGTGKKVATATSAGKFSIVVP